MIKLHGKWTLKLSATLCVYAAQYYKHSCWSISAHLHPCRFSPASIQTASHLCSTSLEKMPIWINIWQHVEDTSLQSLDWSIIFFTNPMPIIGMFFGRKPKLHNTNSGSDHTYTLTNQMRSFSLRESWRRLLCDVQSASCIFAGKNFSVYSQMDLLQQKIMPLYRY